MCVQDYTGEAASLAQKQLVYYELDLGLNHVVRKSSEDIDNGANMLIPVPGATPIPGDKLKQSTGPGGLLVCAENFIFYMKEGHPTLQAVIPRRSNLPEDRGVLIVAWHVHRMKTSFFHLLQVGQFLCGAYVCRQYVCSKVAES